MATGDVLNPSRPQYTSNERYDVVDAAAQSLSTREHLDVIAKALIATTRATGGSTATGLILTGGSLTNNPTGAGDGKIRINTELLVALDADGRLIIKPAGTTSTVSITGTQQIYLYYTEDDTENAVRRFISVSSPYVETPQSVYTRHAATFGVYVRTGDNTTIIASDVVAGATRALVFLGLATNSAGTVTNDVSATVNRLSTVAVPTAPASNVANGSMKTVHDLVVAALYTIGQAAWKGSSYLTPAAANNYGAYNIPAGGVDKAFRNAMGLVTIGNGTTVRGDFDQSDYASDNLCLDAAIAALPTAGGTIVLKTGVTLTNFNGTTCTMPAAKTVTIVGDHGSAYPDSAPQITLNAAEWLVAHATSHLILRNLHVRFDANVIMADVGAITLEDCFFEKPSGAWAGSVIATGAASINDITVRGCRFEGTLTANVTTALFFAFTVPSRRVLIQDCTAVYTGTAGAAPFIKADDVRENFVVRNVDVFYNSDTTSGSAVAVYLTSTDNTTEFRGRLVEGLTVRGRITGVTTFGQFSGIALANVGYMTVRDCLFDACLYGIVTLGYTSVGSLLFDNVCVVGYTQGIGYLGTGNLRDTTFSNCRFEACSAWTYNDATSDISNVQFLNCAWVDCQPTMTADGIYRLRFAGCRIERVARATLVGINLTTDTFIRDTVVESCTFTGLGTTATEVCYCVRFHGANIATQCEAVTVRNCVFDDFFNLTYAGSAAVPPSLIEFSTSFYFGINVLNNEGRNILNGGSGTRTQATLVFLRAWTPAATFGLYEMVIKGNRIGRRSTTTADSCVLLSSYGETGGICQSVDIQDNLVSLMWGNVAGSLPTVQLPIIELLASAGNNRLLRVVGNQFHVLDNIAAGFLLGVLQVDAGAYDFETINVTDNQIWTDNASGWDTSAGYGIELIGVNCYNLTLDNNVCQLSGSSATTAIFHVSISGMTSIVNANPTVVSAGTLWTRNLRVHRAP